jgi:anti-anti-sigma factor
MLKSTGAEAKDGLYEIRLKGKITVGEELTTLRDAIRECVWKGKNKIHINMRGVSYVDGSAAPTLHMLFAIVHNSGGVFKLFNVRKKIQRAMGISGINPYNPLISHTAKPLWKFRLAKTS